MGLMERMRITLNEGFSLAKIGTDPERLKAVSKEGKQRYVESWFANYGKDGSHADADGYVAPPLNGILGERALSA